MHEVHRPHLVDRRWYRKRFRRLPIEPFLRLDPQVERQFAVDPVDTLVVPTKALHVTQIQVAQAEPPAFVRCGQPQQPVSYLLVYR